MSMRNSCWIWTWIISTNCNSSSWWELIQNSWIQGCGIGKKMI